MIDSLLILVNDVAINTPGGFLSKWWFVFWDFFIARVTEKHYESVAQVGLIDLPSRDISFIW